MFWFLCYIGLCVQWHCLRLSRRILWERVLGEVFFSLDKEAEVLFHLALHPLSAPDALARSFLEGSDLWLEAWQHERTTVVLEKDDIQVGGLRESWSLQDALTLPDDWIKEWMGSRAASQLEKAGALLGRRSGHSAPVLAAIWI